MKGTLEAEVRNGCVTLTLPEKPVDPKIIEIEKINKEIVERIEKSPESLDSYVKQGYNDDNDINNKKIIGGLSTWIRNTKFGKLMRYLHTEAPFPIRALTYGTEAVTIGGVFGGCTENVTPPVPVQESILLKDVEYQAAGNFNGIGYGCVPATTYMNVNYLGADVTLESVLNDGVVEYRSEIIAYAQKLGFNAKIVQLSTDEIMEVLKKDYPVIAAHYFSLSSNTLHLSLIIGLNQKEKIVTTHDPNTVLGPFYERSFEEFEAISYSSPPGRINCLVIYQGPEPWK